MNNEPMASSEVRRITKMVTLAKDNAADLSEFEVEFMTGLDNKIERYKRKAFISDAEWAILSEVEEKLYGIDPAAYEKAASYA